MAYKYALKTMKQNKIRIPIDGNLAAQVLYDSDRTCCVCNNKGKSVQIHHIDEDPSNNNITNLAVLCLQCHEETQIKGGFGRKLDAPQIIKFRTEWLNRVKSRRQKIDDLFSIETIGTQDEYNIVNNPSNNFEVDEDIRTHEEIYDVSTHETTKLKSYIFKITEIKNVILKYAQEEWNKGATNIVCQATYGVIDFYEEILNELATFYPFNHFGKDPKKYFNELIATRYQWHRLKAETFGAGKSGTMLRIFTASAVMGDVNTMIKDIVFYLTKFKFDLDYKRWEAEWDHKSS